MNFNKLKINFPLGAIASILIFIYLMTSGIWHQLSYPLKFILIIALIILFFCGDFEYQVTKETKLVNES